MRPQVIQYTVTQWGIPTNEGMDRGTIPGLTNAGHFAYPFNSYFFHDIKSTRFIHHFGPYLVAI